MKRMTRTDRAVFAELNAHSRTTEQKQMTIALGYLALVGAIAASVDGFLGSGQTEHWLVGGFLTGLGVIVLLLTLSYRVWKVHYMTRTRELAGDDWIGNPAWLSSDKTLIWTLGVVVVGVGSVTGVNVGADLRDDASTRAIGGIIGFLATSAMCWILWRRSRDRLHWR